MCSRTHGVLYGGAYRVAPHIQEEGVHGCELSGQGLNAASGINPSDYTAQTEDRLDTLFLMNDKFPWRAERRVDGTAPTVGSPDSGSRFQPQTRVSLRAREG